MQQFDWQSGTRYSMLMLTGKSYFEPDKRRRVVEVICDCGKVDWKRWDSVKEGKTQSCGCWPSQRMATLKPATTHGLSNHPLYTVYRKMIERCYDKRHPSFDGYGGRGVTVCEEWTNDFLIFYNWALPRWQEGLELDKDILYCKINGGKQGMIYSPEYCHFVTRKVNGTQKITSRMVEFNGENKTLQQWADETKLGKKVLSSRLDGGWSVEGALTTPCIKGRKFKKR